MSDEWTIRDTKRGNERAAESRAEAEETRNDLIALGASPDQIEIIPPGETDGGEVVETVPADDDTPTVDAPDLPDNPPMETDPVDWLPSHFVDSIQGVPVVNRKGYAVIASKYGISVTAEPVTLPSETDFEYAEFRATATAPDGETFSGFGSAHVDRDDGDDPHLLGELAETRAMKRAVAWASGVGMTAAVEMQGEL